MNVSRLALGLGAVGCHATVDLAMVPNPAVSLRTGRVAVVARERGCLDTANALVEALQRDSSVVVDPGHADVRLQLYGCGDAQTWEIEQLGGVEVGRRATARAYALVEVATADGVVANLIGSGIDDSGASLVPTDPIPGTRALRRGAVEDLADDLLHQLVPVPTLVERRIYPNAPRGSARGLLTAAVHAEAGGDLRSAMDLAEAAWHLDPDARTAGYLRDLRRARSTVSER